MPSHHYVPQFYLRKFCSPETPPGHEPFLWTCSKSTRVWRKRAPKNVGCKAGFYKVEGVKGVGSEDLERIFGLVETKMAALYRAKIDQFELPIEFDERGLLSEFIAMFVARSPFARRLVEAPMKQMLLATASHLAKSPGVLERSIQERQGLKGEELKLEAEKTREFMKDRSKYVLEPKKEFVMAMALQLSETIARFVYCMKWKLLIAPFGQFFITGDSPAHWEDPTPRPPILAGHGLAMEHVEFVLPLSAKICFLAGWNYSPGVYIASTQQVLDICNRVMAWSEDEVFSPRPFDFVRLEEKSRQPLIGVPSSSRNPGFHIPTESEAKALGLRPRSRRSK